MTEFVPANRLYDVATRTTIAHPAHQPTDEQVRRAVEKPEVRTDGGTERCETCHLEKIGGRCLTRWCEDRHASVDKVFGGSQDGGSR